jgi:hypothetical protein
MLAAPGGPEPEPPQDEITAASVVLANRHRMPIIAPV